MEVIELSKVLDLVAAPLLLENFLQKKGNNLQVSADQVQRVGAQCLQVLLASRKAWEADGFDLSIVNPSEAFTEALTLMGVAVESLTYHADDSHREE